MGSFVLGQDLSFVGKTTVHPVGLTMLLAAMAALMTVPRRFAPGVIIAMAALVPSAQRVVIAGLDFNFIRLLALAGLVRVLMRGEWSNIRWNGIDTCAVFLAAFHLVGTVGTFGFGPATIGQIGADFEALLVYAVLRATLVAPSDLRSTLVVVAVVTVVAAPFFLVERSTGKNMFSVMGGVPAITMEREGKLRCQGAIAHAILAGCFFAAFVPIWIAMVVGSRKRALPLVASAAAAVIVVCCASSTPVVTLMQAALGWCFYRARYQLRLLWIGLLLLLTALHFLMQKPVWHLIARIDLVGGSTGWHRYHLIDAAINRIGEWFVFGTASTAHWGWGLEDVTNQFILDGVRGGLGATLALVVCFVLGFGYCGSWLRHARIARSRAASKVERAAILQNEALAFGVGVALFIHVGNFLAVSYFGQATVVWLFVLACAASIPGWRRSVPGTVSATASPARSAERWSSVNGSAQNSPDVQPEAGIGQSHPRRPISAGGRP